MIRQDPVNEELSLAGSTRRGNEARVTATSRDRPAIGQLGGPVMPMRPSSCKRSIYSSGTGGKRPLVPTCGQNGALIAVSAAPGQPRRIPGINRAGPGG